MEVTGIATTFLATMDVLEKAKEKGLNMIITHEPTFYNHFDQIDLYGNDEIIRAKNNYIRDHNLIVYRFHDHIHQTSPDIMYKGTVDKMNWQDIEVSQSPYIYKLSETTLAKLTEQLKIMFNVPTIRASY